MRPASLDEVIGQAHLLGPGAPLRRLVEGGSPSSMLLYGPPGTGKTTLAMLVAGGTGRRFAQLSAVSAGVKEVRAVIADAKAALRSTGEQTVLFIDEVHRFSRTQQDSLLGAVEDRTIILIAATTENPFFSVVSPLLSQIAGAATATADRRTRSATLLDRAVTDPRGLAGRFTLADEARAHLVALAGGDARRALTALEEAAGAVESLAATVADEDPATGRTPAEIDLAAVERAVNRAAVRYDRSGDQHYDVTSAFIKSIRGSDVDAALHYLARMIEAGEDPRFIARRLMIHASEDVGMADPTALPISGRGGPGGAAGRPARGPDRVGAGHDPPGHRTEVECCGDRDRRGHGRRQGGQGRQRAAVPAGRPLPGGRPAGHAQSYVYPHDRPGWHRRPAVPAGRTRRPRLLPTDRPRSRTRRSPSGWTHCGVRFASDGERTARVTWSARGH